MKNLLESYLNYIEEANKLERMLDLGKASLKNLSPEQKAKVSTMMRPRNKMTKGSIKGLVAAGKKRGYNIRHDELANLVGPHVNPNTKEVLLPSNWRKLGGQEFSRREARRMKLAIGPHEREEISDIERVRKGVLKKTGKEPEYYLATHGVGHMSKNPPAVEARKTAELSKRYGKNLSPKIVQIARDAETRYTGAPSLAQYEKMGKKEMKQSINDVVNMHAQHGKEIKKQFPPEIKKLFKDMKNAKTEDEKKLLRQKLTAKVKEIMGNT